MKTIRIAMWSGPRNISTAMMRSWENRADTIVIDEPLYGPYLHKTQKRHPMFAEIINNQGTDTPSIINHLIQDHLPDNKTIFYQKHMCHHIIDNLDISWIKHFKNVFLIRNPRYVLSSYLRKHDNPTPEDLGYPQQLKLFNYIKNNCGYTPIVLESKDILKNPKRMIELLCKKLGIAFERNMLSWPKGYRSSDGIWARHWYNRVIESTGFSKYQANEMSLSVSEENIAIQCMPYYLELLKYKLDCKIQPLQKPLK